jgi:hypothetical protein
MGVRGLAVIGIVLLGLLALAIALLWVFSVSISMETVRDLVIIVYGVMGILVLLVLIIVLLALYFVIRRLSAIMGDLLEDPVKPALEELRASAANVRGTTEFMADTAVHPLIRVVSVARGIRRGVRSVTGLRPRGR